MAQQNSFPVKRQLEEQLMNNVIVYLDDAAHALQMLASMQAAGSANGPVRWILVGYAPRVTHRVSKWVTHSARENWRSKWAEKVFTQLTPLLQQGDDTVVTLLADSALPLALQTQTLCGQYGNALVFDARRPKLSHDMQPVSPLPAHKSHTLISYVMTLLGTGVLAVAD